MIRIGVDFGGTKIEAAALTRPAASWRGVRAPNPGDYAAALEAVRALVEKAEAQAGADAAAGWASPCPARSRRGRDGAQRQQRLAERPPLRRGTWRAFSAGRCAWPTTPTAWPVGGDGRRRCGARGWCSRRSSAPGSAAGSSWTGRLVEGRNGVAGDWGHTPLPWLNPDDEPGEPVRCWCGRDDCLETYFSGPGLARDYREQTGETLSPAEIVAAARGGRFEAAIALEQ